MQKRKEERFSLNRNDFFMNTVFRKYLLASVAGMMAASVSGMTDTVIVGRFLGEEGLAAMSLVSPVYLLYYTVGAVIGAGGSIAANHSIGRNRYEEYKSIFTLSCCMMAVMCVIMTGSGLCFLPQLMTALGGGGIVREYGEAYLSYYIAGGSTTLLLYLPLNFLKTEGKPQAATGLFLLSSGMNVALTWLFLSPVCNMGIRGAAAATALSMGTAAAAGFGLLMKGKGNTGFCRPRQTGKLAGEILRAGSPSGANNLCQSVRVMCLNHMILGIGAEALLPAFLLTRTVSDVMQSIMAGMAAALIPIIGVYYGEKDNQSMRVILKKTALAGGVAAAGLAALTAAGPEWMCRLFGIQDQAAAHQAVIALECLAVSLLFAFFNLLYTGYFNAVNRPALSNVILLLRLLLYMLGPAYLLSIRIGIYGIWISQVCAEALTLITLWILILLIRRRSPELDGCLLNRKEEGMAEISFSVRNDPEDIVFASTKITDFCSENKIDGMKGMQVSLALEEMLTILISYCMDTEKEQFMDVRIKKVEEDIMIRIRSSGKIFNPILFYEENKDREEMFEKLLGIKLMVNGAKSIDFRETFGANNLLIYF